MRHGEVSRYDTCAECGEPKPLSTSETCRKCYDKAQKGKPFGGLSKIHLSVRKLTPEQRRLFDAILRGHRWTAETRDDALGMIQRAQANGTLGDELAFWTGSAESEPPHKTTSLGLMSAFAPGNI